MILKMYTVYDSITKIYHPPMYCHNDNHAKRVFKAIINAKDKVFNTSPADFSLCEVGTFNDQDGNIETVKVPILIIEGTEVLEKEKKP